MEQYGFIRVYNSSPELRVADCNFNTQKCKEEILKAEAQGCDIAVFPELCITGATCGDLFLSDTLLSASMKCLKELAYDTRNIDMAVICSLPVSIGHSLYDCCALLYKGEIKGFIPKKNIPNSGPSYELRYFTAYEDGNIDTYEGIPFGNMIFNYHGVKIGIEIGQDMYALQSPSEELALQGALLLFDPSADNEIAGRDSYRRIMACAHSSKTVSAYIICNSGSGESTTDAVYSGHNIITEKGRILCESKPFEGNAIIADIDTQLLLNERRKSNLFTVSKKKYPVIDIEGDLLNRSDLRRTYPMYPFIPSDPDKRRQRCSDITDMQAYSIIKRMKHIHCNSAVIGISGGLDSTATLLATIKAFDIMGLDRKAIHAITMPCFGTSDRTYNNAVQMCIMLGVTFKEISIKESLLCHFKDIGHDINKHDVAYENAQARERTQILMDYANQIGAIVLGTGDLSELALGWATFNGDHMSMYCVNGSIPKTLIKYIVAYFADSYSDDIRKVLYDVIDTPISPELLPPDKGSIAQKTENIVGPYALHDFFIYYFLRYGFAPSKLYYIAGKAFDGVYDLAEINKWLKVFIKRFFSQQFKRSCLPDGPKLGSVALSPRGDLRMPSDAVSSVWLDDIEDL